MLLRSLVMRAVPLWSESANGRTRTRRAPFSAMLRSSASANGSKHTIEAAGFGERDAQRVPADVGADVVEDARVAQQLEHETQIVRLVRSECVHGEDVPAFGGVVAKHHAVDDDDGLRKEAKLDP